MLVDVRPLLAIDFHADEIAVHLRRDLGVLEGLVRHDVAPMAGGVADRKHHGRVARSGLFEGLATPQAPIHGICGVLEEVGRGARA